MKADSKSGVAIYFMLALLAVISLVILFQLRRQFEESLQGRVADLQRVFSNRSLLKGPKDSNINFGEIEAEVAKYENRGGFGALRILKSFSGKSRTVYPFYEDALTLAGIQKEPPPTPPQGWTDTLFRVEKNLSLPLISDGTQLGTLQAVVIYTPLRVVSVVIWFLATMLALSLGFMANTFRRQEKVISATTIELEAKRRELVRLERLALAGQLSANILHDLKKPVLNIRNEAEEGLNPISHEGALSPDEILHRVREQADFFLSVLREGGYDRFVRSREEREYVDINELLDRSLALVRYEQGNIQIQRQYSPGLPAVHAEPVRLIQVFSNLILNACQAMKGNGQLRIETREAERGVVIAIQDNGPGIPHPMQQRIFEPFYTTKAEGEGTGLGLYIARDIILELKGDLHLTSQPGHTVFLIELPAAG